MKRLLQITAGLIVVDLLVIAFARPLLTLFEGNHEGIGWGVLAVRYAAAAIGAGLGLFLLVVWIARHNLPKE